MKRIFVLALLFLASPAYADCSQGDGARMPNACDGRNHVFPEHRDPDYDRYVVRQPVRAAAKKVAPATINPWKHDYAPFAQAGSMPAAGLQGAFVPSLTTSELATQLEINRGYHRELRARLIQQGGTAGEFLPVWVATDQRLSRGTFGEGPQMGSNGGD